MKEDAGALGTTTAHRFPPDSPLKENIFSSTLTLAGGFCCRLVTGAGSCCFTGGTGWAFAGAELGLDDDFDADFLNMDVRFFPVLKKAAPTNIFGLGFRLPKETVMAFLGSADLTAALLLLLPEGPAGFAATLPSRKNHKLMLFNKE